MDADFETITRELYQLPPAHFTRARNARADQAKKADRDLAARIRELRRPTTGAWLANILAWRRSPEITRLVELGQALRAAQNALDADTLRTLTAQRRQVVEALTALAMSDAAALGQLPGDEALRELEQTLHAALTHPAAAQALTRGRLTAALLPGTALPAAASGADPTHTPPPRSAPTAHREALAAARQKEAGRPALAAAEEAAPSPNGPARENELRARRLTQAQRRSADADREAAGAAARAERTRSEYERHIAQARQLRAEADRAAVAWEEAQALAEEAERAERFSRVNAEDAERDAAEARRCALEARRQLDDVNAAPL